MRQKRYGDIIKLLKYVVTVEIININAIKVYLRLFYS
jgi:hypothetical protein